MSRLLILEKKRRPSIVHLNTPPYTYLLCKGEKEESKEILSSDPESTEVSRLSLKTLSLKCSVNPTVILVKSQPRIESLWTKTEVTPNNPGKIGREVRPRLVRQSKEGRIPKPDYRTIRK